MMMILKQFKKLNTVMKENNKKKIKILKNRKLKKKKQVNIKKNK
jgi:hypothetical protein